MKTLIRMKYFPLIVLSALLMSCSKDNPQPSDPTGEPIITFVDGNNERKLKIGKSVILRALVENAIQPMFTWKIDGKIVSTETVFTFVADEVGEYFVNFRVDASNGSAEEQIKISVLDKTPPKITLGSYQIAFSGRDTEFVAKADYADKATYVWRLNGEIVSETASYKFNQTTLGDYVLTLEAVTEDGQDLKLITVTVMPEQQAEIFFDNGRYRTENNKNELRKMTVPHGKSLVLAPVVCNIPDTTGFVWTVNGDVKQTGKSVYYTFTPESVGIYLISVTEQGTNITAEVEVTCTEPEGTYRRSGGTKNHATDAFDYIPAPGQFINYQNGSTKAIALQSLQTWCDNGDQEYFHIGAFGGYFIVGFDHSVINASDKADLQINGNPLNTWCEQGVVWVMQDDNGNGKPDDTWYELGGSETGKPTTVQRLAITYYKPKVANADVLWIDNIGRGGSVEWNEHHHQQYYYPMFIAENNYTLTGTCLASTAGMSGGLEVAMCYEWGYVDNNSNNGRRPANQFWIEDAIQADGTPIHLQYIDFVKVHTSTTGKNATVGEVSTEAYLPIDLNF
jgi:hypothetical protein